MANDAAWQAGIDIASGKRGKKKDDAPKNADGQGTPASGGLLGLASKGISRLRGKPKAGGGGSANNMARGLMQPTASFQSPLDFGGSRKKGGPIKKTAIYLLHKGEYVVPANKTGSKKSRRKTAGKRTTIKA